MPHPTRPGAACCRSAPPGSPAGGRWTRSSPSCGGWAGRWGSTTCSARRRRPGCSSRSRGEDATGFQGVGPPLRFDQSAAVSRIVDAVLAARCDPDEAVERLGGVLAAPPLLPRWAVAAGLIPVSAGIGLILQPAPENLLAGVLCSVLVAVLIEVAARSRLALTLLPVVAPSSSAARSSSPPTRPARRPAADAAAAAGGAAAGRADRHRMSELAAGAMVAGTSRLVFGTVQLLLFSRRRARGGARVGLPAQELATCASTSSAAGPRGRGSCCSASVSA